jgi:hypothetical protein
MAKEIIDSFEKLHSFVQSYTGKGAVYRGVKSSGFELVPQIGRINEFEEQDIKDIEKKMLSQFKGQAKAYIDVIPEDEWDGMGLLWLNIMDYQHGYWIGQEIH